MSAGPPSWTSCCDVYYYDNNANIRVYVYLCSREGPGGNAITRRPYPGRAKRTGWLGGRQPCLATLNFIIIITIGWPPRESYRPDRYRIDGHSADETIAIACLVVSPSRTRHRRTGFNVLNVFRVKTLPRFSVSIRKPFSVLIRKPFYSCLSVFVAQPNSRVSVAQSTRTYIQTFIQTYEPRIVREPTPVP